MPPDERDLALLLDMMRYAEAVVRITHGRALQDYLRDERLRLATERAIEIVGEAARHVSVEFQSRHPTVPWRKIAAQRHVLAHDYGELDHEVIWRVATIHIPALIDAMRPMLPPEGPSSHDTN